jgi:hypothetical protein
MDGIHWWRHRFEDNALQRIATIVFLLDPSLTLRASAGAEVRYGLNEWRFRHQDDQTMRATATPQANTSNCRWRRQGVGFVGYPYRYRAGQIIVVRRRNGCSSAHQREVFFRCARTACNFLIIFLLRCSLAQFLQEALVLPEAPTSPNRAGGLEE